MPAFETVSTSLQFPELEKRVLRFWKEQGIFQKSLRQREGAPTWVFYEGPPTANGKPHPGHVLTRVVKDLFPRYKTMSGFSVPRKAGWDTHGLPVEIEVEKELKLTRKDEVEAYGVERFVRKCMDSVFRYTADWEELTERIGFWIDLQEAYVTYHQSFVESVWWSLKQLHQKGLLYRGHKILPWCPLTGSSISNHETEYRQVDDPSVYVTFRSLDDPRLSFLAWTTTPWTLPSNAGLAVRPQTLYAHVRVGQEGDERAETLILAQELVEKVLGKLPHQILKTEPGSALVGRRYRPLFDWWQGSEAERREAWKVCAADFVDLTTGSGIVHLAPAFGADDYALGQKEGLPMIQLVNTNGCFSSGCGAFAGRFVKDADKDLVQDLKDRGLLLKRETYRHDYPFNSRRNSPLIYFAREGWFIRTTREIGKVMRNNQVIDWHPSHIRDGRFGKFLESNIDWALSRERFWGTPLPIWRCAGCGFEEALESLAELTGKTGVEGLDHFDKARAADPALNPHLRVHKPWIDAVHYACPKCQGRARRVPEVIDCWYDSGAMPFAQWGYPHLPGSRERFAQAFPADFISEAIDQTRGWFYSLLAESTMLFDQAKHPHPYKTCLVLGHVCDEKGEKMSKSKGNYLDPLAILNEEGADALRWFFYASTNPWTSARFARSTVREAQKEFLLKLYNVYSFFVIYANIDGFDPATGPAGSGPAFARAQFGGRPLPERFLLDRWVLGELYQTVDGVRRKLDLYDIFGAAEDLSAFAESLSNWYLQRTRERYWRSWRSQRRNVPEDLDKLDAYWTLYECLVTFSQLIAPFVPFLAEELWQNLVRRPLGGSRPESVHLSDYPKPDPAVVDSALAAEVALVREVVGLGRTARSARKLKTRLPLAKVVLVLTDPAQQRIVERHAEIVREALNVKAIEFARQADQYVAYQLKPNFKEIGAKYRDLVPEIKRALQQANAAHLRNKFANDGCCTLQLESQQITLSQGEVEVGIQAKEGYAAAGGRQVVLVLETKVTQELLDEGFARELVNRIQNLRRDLDLKYEQRIQLALDGSPRLQELARKFERYICGETLAVALQLGPVPDGWRQAQEGIEVEGERGRLGILEA